MRRRLYAVALVLAALALPSSAYAATTSVPVDPAQVSATYFYADYYGMNPSCTGSGGAFDANLLLPDVGPPTLPGACGDYTSTNGTLTAHLADHDAGLLTASVDVKNPSRTGTVSMTVDGVAAGSVHLDDHAAETWVSLPSIPVAAHADVAVRVHGDWSGQSGKLEVHAIHGDLDDLPIHYGKPGSFWDTPIPSNVAVNATATANLQSEFASEVTSTNKAALNAGAWTQPVYRFDPTTPRVSVWLWRSSFGTAQPKYVQPRQVQLNVGDPASLTGIPDPTLYGWQPAPSPDSDQEFVAFCALCTSPDGARTGYDVELWRFHACTASDLTYAPLDPATGAPYEWCAGEGGRDTGTDQSAGHPITDYEGYAYGTWPDPFTDPLHVSKYEDKGGLATATSLPNAAGEVTEADVQSGAIDHAIGVSIIYANSGYVWPAQRGDGWANSHPVVKEGERFFLPASTDCPAVMAHPLGVMVCEALKTYGGVIWDKAGAVSFRVEPAVKLDPIWGGVGGSSQLDGLPLTQAQVIGDEATGNYGSDSTPFPLAAP